MSCRRSSQGPGARPLDPARAAGVLTVTGAVDRQPRDALTPERQRAGRSWEASASTSDSAEQLAELADLVRGAGRRTRSGAPWRPRASRLRSSMIPSLVEIGPLEVDRRRGSTTAFPFPLRSLGVIQLANMSDTRCLIVWGSIPCSAFYADCSPRRRLVSLIARCIESVTLSAYMITWPSTLRAARPIVWISDVSQRRKPSLSASRMATSDTSGRSRPSRSRLIPTSTSKSPRRSSRRISTRSKVSISECR